MGRGGMGAHPRTPISNPNQPPTSRSWYPTSPFSCTGRKRRNDGRGRKRCRLTQTDGPLDFFVQRPERKNEDGLSLLSKDLEQDDEQKEKPPSTAAHRFSKLWRNLGDVPTAMLRQALVMDDMSNLKTKSNHRQQSSFPVFSTTATTNTKTCDRESQRSSMSGLPLDERNRVGDDLSMSVSTTDPDPKAPPFSSCTLRTSRTTAYYLGTESRPKTVPPSGLSDSKAAVSPFDEPSRLYDSESQAIRCHRSDGSSESSVVPFPESRVTELRTTPSPTRRPSEESHRWSGEWNARLPDVIHALRELR